MSLSYCNSGIVGNSGLWVAAIRGHGERVWHFMPLWAVNGPLSGGYFGPGDMWFSGGAGEITEHRSEGGGEKQGVENSVRHHHILRGKNLTWLLSSLLGTTKPGGQAVDLHLTGLEPSVQTGPLLLSLDLLSCTGERPGQRHLYPRVGTAPLWVQVTPAALRSAWTVRQSD